MRRIQRNKQRIREEKGDQVFSDWQVIKCSCDVMGAWQGQRRVAGDKDLEEFGFLFHGKSWKPVSQSRAKLKGTFKVTPHPLAASNILM